MRVGDYPLNLSLGGIMCSVLDSLNDSDLKRLVGDLIGQSNFCKGTLIRIASSRTSAEICEAAPWMRSKYANHNS